MVSPKNSFRALFVLALLIFHQLLTADMTQGGSTVGFKKLPSKYTVSYGDPNAQIHITEYFSFSCPKCLEFIRRDFSTILSSYIDTGKVYWIFHPDPADIITLQAMMCFEKLDNNKRQNLLRELAYSINLRYPKKASLKMQERMSEFGCPVPYLKDLSFLERSEAFQFAYTYLKQAEAPVELPTIEINGKLYQEFPCVKWIQQTLLSLPDNLKPFLPSVDELETEMNRGIYENS